MKRIIICLYFMLILSVGSTYAQLESAEIIQTFRIEASNIECISKIGDQYYLNSCDETYLVGGHGEIIERFHHDSRYGCYFDQQNGTTITQDGLIYSGENLVEDVSKELSSIHMISKFLAKSSDGFYSCFLHPEKMSYSSGIFRITDNRYSLFTYLVGVPAGIYVSNNSLWYLCHTTPQQKGILREYDLQSGELVNQILIPVEAPIGLVVESDLCYVFSNVTMELVVLNIRRN